MIPGKLAVSGWALTKTGAKYMAKGRDSQKTEKKKSEKTLKEKRKEKKEKKSKKGAV
jgi:hypothetical protein